MNVIIQTDGRLRAFAAIVLLTGCAWCQTPGAPAISAQAKGPDQINLTWPAVSEPGYGYLVEIQSPADSRYGSWTELEPIPRASGYTCDGSIFVRGASCGVSDAAGDHVYNPPNKGVAPWVTDANYIDPQDGTRAQFIAWGLKPGTTYSFRVRTYSGQSAPRYGAYSNVVSAKTADYALRYVSTAGNDSNDGKAADAAHAWRTLAYGAKSIACGQALIVMGGSYANDQIQMGQSCTADAKAVVLVNPGEAATLISQPAGSMHVVTLAGQHGVIDGLQLASAGGVEGEYDLEIRGGYNALLNVEAHAPVVPSFKFGVVVYAGHNLIYHCYLHDYGSPDPTQNPNGDGGFVLALLWGGAAENVIWSNHLTRGGHDESLCKGGCNNNRWLNNVMDGGWGQGWIAVFSGGPSDNNLVEGNVIKSVGQLVPYFKPAIQVSGAGNTVRRNVVIQSRTWALEVSSFSGGSASYNLFYNNTLYAPGGCYFQSSSRGARFYYHDIFTNNICFKIQNLGTQIYLGNTTNRIASNDLLFVDVTGKAQPEHALVIWNQLAGGSFEGAKPVGAADRTYDPPFSKNRSLSVMPQFADEANADFHLRADSPLLGAGIAMANTGWGSSTGAVDLGAFGLTISNASNWPAGAAMEWGRAGDFEAALKGLRASPGTPNAPLLEAALLRAADDDAGAAAVLAKLPAPADNDLIGRFERLRQGNTDVSLWAALEAAPDRALEIADLYLQWGLARDALELLGHKGPRGAPSPDDALFLYYRSYCRAVLDYPYYASEDLRVAGTRGLKDVPARLGAALAVLQSALQQNPVDPYAQYLTGVAQRNAGRMEAARDAVESALRLRPGFPDAEALLAKLPAGPTRAVRPAATTAVAVPKSPAEVVTLALRIAASGDISGAMSYFTPANFASAKQEDAVREAYIELRLRSLMANKQCAGLAGLEAPDPRLPFTAGGFGEFTKGARFQYLVGTMEASCGNEAAARKRWEQVSKADAGITTTDYAYPMLALTKLDPNVGRARSRTSLGFLTRQLGTAAANHQGAMLYSQGLLLLAIGKQAEAMSSFQAGAEAGSAGLVEFLNLEAMRSPGQ
jgi:tetratricopeptide (TPR) repeat protein